VIAAHSTSVPANAERVLDTAGGRRGQPDGPSMTGSLRNVAVDHPGRGMWPSLFAWLQPRLWRCPRGLTVLLTRTAGPRRPECGPQRELVGKPMSEACSCPEVSPGGVRTPQDRALLPSRQCPICLKAELQGQQTVCSAACRHQRSRQREAEARQARDREVADLLRAALKKLQDSR